MSSEARFGRALLATGFAYDVHDAARDNLEEFARVVKRAGGVRRDGSAAIDLCYVACGRFEGYWELKLHAWDVAAGILIVEEAGGRVTDLARRTTARVGQRDRREQRRDPRRAPAGAGGATGVVTSLGSGSTRRSTPVARRWRDRTLRPRGGSGRWIASSISRS